MRQDFSFPLRPEDRKVKKMLDAAKNAKAEFLPLVGDRGVAVDVGAYVGTWTQWLADEFEGVIAFEPNPPAFEHLKKNVGNCPNVRLFNIALYSTACEMKLSHENSVPFPRLVEGTGVLTSTLDDQIVECDFLKIDVEGPETLVLMGGENLIRRCRPVIVVEDKGHWGRYKTQAPGNYLKSLGYKMAKKTRIDRAYVYE